MYFKYYYDNIITRNRYVYYSNFYHINFVARTFLNLIINNLQYHSMQQRENIFYDSFSLP